MPARKKPAKRTRVPRPEVIHDYYGKPLNTTIARSHVVELFVKRPAWNRDALIKAVIEAHSRAGGVEGTRSPMMCVNDALKGLKHVGIVNNEVMGLWRLVGKLPEMVKHGDQTILDMQVEGGPELPTQLLTAAQEPEGTEIGEGKECVCVLYNATEQRLAMMEGRPYWDCRISRSADDALPYFPRHPITGLVIRTDNAEALESLLQATLAFMNAETGAVPNSGWFYTSPDAVKQWFLSFQQSLPQFNEIR